MEMALSCEAKVSTDPEAIASWLHERGYSASKLGFEAGALSTWLFHELTARGWDVVCLETRQVHQVLKAHRDKTDRGDAVGIAQLLRSGWYRPVHIKSFEAHASRALLKARVELVRIRQDLENTIRGLLKPFGIRLPRGDRRTLAVRVRTSCAARTGASGCHGSVCRRASRSWPRSINSKRCSSR
jgi:transposase